MKRLTNAILPVMIEGVNLDIVSGIKFKFQQGGQSLIFDYPSDRATRLDTYTVGLRWSVDETGMFSAQQDVSFDTYVSVIGSDMQVETAPSRFRLTPTLFTREEVVVYD